jgi:hypothetical protein
MSSSSEPSAPMTPKGPAENPADRPPEQKPEADLVAAREALKAQIGRPPADARAETGPRKELTPEQEARLAAAVNEYLAVEEATRAGLAGVRPEEDDEGRRTA